MIKLNLFKRAVIEAVLIAVIASVTGLVVNFFHPHGVVIVFSRPQAEHVADNVLRDGEPSAEPVAINRAQLLTLLAENGTALLDARMPDAFSENHLPGAVNVPFEMLGSFMELIENLPRENWVICYCDGPPCDLGELLAAELKNMGFTRIAFYPDGLEDWIKAGETVESGGDQHER